MWAMHSEGAARALGLHTKQCAQQPECSSQHPEACLLLHRWAFGLLRVCVLSSPRIVCVCVKAGPHPFIPTRQPDPIWAQFTSPRLTYILPAIRFHSNGLAQKSFPDSPSLSSPPPSLLSSLALPWLVFFFPRNTFFLLTNIQNWFMKINETMSLPPFIFLCELSFVFIHHLKPDC